jgi:hypothetical protein
MEMKKKLLTAVFGALLCCVSGQVFSAAVTDVISAPTGYFAPDESSATSSPYYRWANDDWGWTHNAIGGTISSASLNIDAWDVDYADGERSSISAWSNDIDGWVLLGYLTGDNATWSYTTFSLDSSWFDEIAAGLQVWMDIDTTGDGWAVSLAKSALEVNGGEIPGPGPNPVPVPAAVWLFGSGLLGLAGFSRKKKAEA